MKKVIVLDVKSIASQMGLDTKKVSEILNMQLVR